VDNWGIQVDAYAASAQQARDVSKALSDALEGKAHVTAWNGEDRETETNLYRVCFTVEFWTPSSPPPRLLAG
jgi:NMD protein affecting ribosome stability and mRNA decay